MSSQQQQEKLKAEGNALVQKQQFEQAATIYTKALELDCTSEASAAIFSNRSLCYLNTKKYTEALQDAEKAISLRPTWFRGYQRAAAACEKLNNKSEEGLKYLEKCFELDEASKTDSVFKKMKEDFEINIIKQKAPSMTQDELKQIGNTFVKSQQYEKAVTVYTLAIEKDAFCDEAAPILSNRSLCYFNLNKFKEAYEDAGCCCGIKPEWAKGFLRRGTAAQKLEEWQIALESFDEYLKLDPQDEASVKSSRDAVLKIVTEKKNEEEVKAHALKLLEKEVAKVENPDERLAKKYEILLHSVGKLDINAMKLATKQPQPARLDTPVLKRFIQHDMYSGFLPGPLKMAKEKLRTSPDSDEFMLVAGLLMAAFGNHAVFGKYTMAHQVEVLDFFLDVAEEQEFDAPDGSMRWALTKICWYDPSSPKFSSTRKDLILTLFDRIDTARNFFLGKSASKKDFASAVLAALCNDFTPQTSMYHNVSSDLCTRDNYECIQTALKNGADPTSTFKCLNDDQGTIFDRAIINLRSVQVVELMLRHGADVNFISKQEEDVTTSIVNAAGKPSREEVVKRYISANPLTRALYTYRPDIIGTLLSNGARLPVTGKLPGAVLQQFPAAKFPLVKPNFCDHLTNVLIMRHRGNQERHFTEDYFRVLFDLISKQELSFLCPDDPSMQRSSTPLTLAVSVALNVNVIETMLKLQPGLLKMFVNRDSSGGTILGSAVAILIYGLAMHPAITLPYASSVVRLFKKHGFDFDSDIVQYDLKKKKTTSVTATYLLRSKMEDYVDERRQRLAGLLAVMKERK